MRQSSSAWVRLLAPIVALLALVLQAPAWGAETAVPPPPPANDAIGAAVAIGAVPADVPGSTLGATMDPAEPTPFVVDSAYLDRTVWFSFQSDRTSEFLTDTCDSNFASHLDVYTGPVDKPQPVATTSESFEGCAGDRLSFAATAGTTYFLRVSTRRDADDAQRPEGGVFHLTLKPQQPPGNDAFAEATPLPGIGNYPVSLPFSTIELGEPAFSYDRGSVWYRLAPQRDQAFTAEVPPNAGFATTLVAFQAKRTGIEGLVDLDDDYASSGSRARVSFNALAGHAYYLRVATDARLGGETRLVVTTNTARGVGLVITPASNTIASVRRSGFKAVLSCVRTCRVGVDLLIGGRDAVRLGLVRTPPVCALEPKTPKRNRACRRAKRQAARTPVKVGHVNGSLLTGVPRNVTIPLVGRTRTKLFGLAQVHFIVRANVRGVRNSAPVTHRIVVARR